MDLLHARRIPSSRHIPFSALLAAVVLAHAAAAPVLGSQEALAPVLLVRSASGPYTTVERSDWSRYDNGKYTGHTYREVRSFLRPVSERSYRGEIFVLEETLRDLRPGARSLDALIPVEFTIDSSGNLTVLRDQGHPSLRGFPSFPKAAVVPGTTWVAQGSRAVDPRNEGIPVLLPIVVQYEYRGVEVYKGIPVHRVFAKYATRYRAVGGPASFVSAQGTHDVDILIRASDGLPLMMRDRLDETFTWPDGSTVRFRGFTLTFSEGSLPLDRGAVVADLRGALGAPQTGTSAAPPSAAGAAFDDGATTPPAAGAGPAGGGGTATAPASGAGGASGVAVSAAPVDTAGPGPELVRSGPEGISLGALEQVPSGAAGIEVAPVPEGVRLTVRDLRFTADSDRLLPEERRRLDLLAQALRGVGERTILVEGHTAAVGRPAGELELSIARAKRIVEELSARGIPADRFLYKGWGGAKPAADNATEEGRARNRRVEITILE